VRSRLLLALAMAVLAVMLLGRLSHPLLWQDEGETAMFASRVVEYGYPKVHGPRNVVYEFGPNVALGVKESLDAYIGKTWGDFYFAAPAVIWARASGDPYAQAFRLRLPFALAGVLGLAALLWGVLPVLPPDRRVAFAAAFLGLCAVSISLLLHLREVRYYALLLASLGGLLALHLRDERAGTRDAAGWRGRALLQALVSLLLFQSFYVAWFVATPLLAADRLWQVRREGAALRSRVALRALAPQLLAVVAVAPWLVFLETFQVARGFASHVGVTPGGYLENARLVSVHFARHEMLVPALLCLVTASWVLRREPAPQRPPAHRLAGRLAVFCLAYAAVGCVNPLIYERYFFVLGPLVTLVFLLEAFTLADAAGAHARQVGAALVVLAIAALTPRVGEIRGRLAELRTPVRGPVDFLVEYLRERYPDPSKLVIATNYEAHPLMFHLGSRVIVGLAGNDLVAERELVPDVVVPRRRWPRRLPELARFLRRGEYEEVVLPVQDVHYNDIPSLSRWPSTPDPHRFRTPLRGEPRNRLRVYERVDPQLSSEGGAHRDAPTSAEARSPAPG
jgi:hypothetical protein